MSQTEPITTEQKNVAPNGTIETEQVEIVGSVEERVDRSWQGVDYTIARTQDAASEFVLVIGGVVVATAGELETQAYDAPWIPALETYAQAYIDGMLSEA